jgi:hypothetical protein
MKHLVGKTVTKKTDFLGNEVTIRKLSTAQIKALQVMNSTPAKDGEDQNVLNIRMILRSAVEGAKDVTDAEFDDWPLEDQGLLAGEIVKFSGMANTSGEAPAEGN